MSQKRNVRGLLIQVLGEKCVECGSRSNLEIDHVIPLREGGTDTIDNVALLCVDCHRKKHSPPRQSAERIAPRGEKAVRPSIEKIDQAALRSYLQSPLFLSDPTLSPLDRAHLSGFLGLGNGKLGVQALQCRHNKFHPDQGCLFAEDGLVEYARLRGLTTPGDATP